MFCDIRGFSRVSERIGAAGTIHWINQVFTDLSRCVENTGGVLVNYIGDELMAMWGAPDDQPDHAVRAVRTALEMLEHLGPLRESLAKTTGAQFDFDITDFDFGIGLNTGKAQVGNIGSDVKFLYGPLGNAVNLASRVQGMTKQFGVRAMLTQSTYDAIAQDKELASHCRRLATVQPVGMDAAVVVHQLLAEPHGTWDSLRQRYENSLQLYENAEVAGAASSLASLVLEHSTDKPSVMLLGRAAHALSRPDDPFDPILRLVQK